MLERTRPGLCDQFTLLANVESSTIPTATNEILAAHVVGPDVAQERILQ